MQFGNPSIDGLWKAQHETDDGGKLVDDLFNTYYDDQYQFSYDDATFYAGYYYYNYNAGNGI